MQQGPVICFSGEREVPPLVRRDLPQRIKKLPATAQKACSPGKLEGGRQPASNGIECPARRCGPRSGDFCAAQWYKSNGTASLCRFRLKLNRSAPAVWMAGEREPIR